MSAPWMKFYPRDWRGDQALRAVSVAARGLWIDCLCIMHEAKPYGHLVLNGSSIDGDTLARMTGVPADAVSALLAELRQAGVLSVTGKGVVFSRRMTKDFSRAQKGKKYAEKRWTQITDKSRENDGPNGSPNSNPTTQKPEARSQIDIKPLAQQSVAAAPRERIERLLEATGIKGNPPTAMAFAGEIFALEEGGYDFESEILPGIRAKPNPGARTWGYFMPQIHDFVRRRRENVSAAKAAPVVVPVDWGGRMDVFGQHGTWVHAWGPKPGEAGCKVPPAFIQDRSDDQIRRELKL